MGNYVSRKLANLRHKNNSRSSTRVILPTGEIRQIHQPTKAAEIMMEAPNLFLVNTKSLKIGRRFFPLKADDDLEKKGNLYAAYPMHRKNSVVTAADMAALLNTTNLALKRASKRDIGIRLLPAADDQSALNREVGVEDMSSTTEPRLSLEGVDEDVSSNLHISSWMSIRRTSKKPLLDTIEEDPMCLR